MAKVTNTVCNRKKLTNGYMKICLNMFKYYLAKECKLATRDYQVSPINSDDTQWLRRWGQRPEESSNCFSVNDVTVYTSKSLNT